MPHAFIPRINQAVIEVNEAASILCMKATRLRFDLRVLVAESALSKTEKLELLCQVNRLPEQDPQQLINSVAQIILSAEPSATQEEARE